jgi:hypothetical protein
MSVTTPFNTPASQAGDLIDQIGHAKAAFGAVETIAEDISGNITAFEKAYPDLKGSYGDTNALSYVLVALHDELRTLEMQAEELKNRLKAEHQQAAE